MPHELLMDEPSAVSRDPKAGVRRASATLWVTMLALQSLPYISTLACQIISQMPDRTPESKAAPIIPA